MLAWFCIHCLSVSNTLNTKYCIPAASAVVVATVVAVVILVLVVVAAGVVGTGVVGAGVTGKKKLLR